MLQSLTQSEIIGVRTDVSQKCVILVPLKRGYARQKAVEGPVLGLPAGAVQATRDGAHVGFSAVQQQTNLIWRRAQPALTETELQILGLLFLRYALWVVAVKCA